MTVPSPTPEQLKALDSTLATIRRLYGTGAIMRLDGSVAEGVDVISTGSLGLDLALGIGGVPRGRMTEIFGPESSGKTTVALHLIAEAQRGGGIAAFVDAEHAFDPAYARRLGVRVEDLVVSQPDSGEQALELVEHLVRSGAVDLVVVDSVAALAPAAELEGQMGDAQVGLQARMMSKAMRKLTALISRTRCAVLFINQLRQKIGVTFGPSEVTTGGNALKYYTSVRLDIRRIGGVKAGDDAVGSRTRVRVVKNKLAAPFRTAEFEILFGTGISRSGELVDLGEAVGAIVRSGSWYSCGDVRLGQGRESARQRLEEDAALASRVEHLIRTHGVPDRMGAAEA